MKYMIWKKVSLLCFVLSMTLTAGSVYAAQAEEDAFAIAVMEDEVTFHTQLQQDALDAGAEHISEYSNLGKDELSIPEGITLNWTYESDLLPEFYTVTLSRNEDLSDPLVLKAEGGSGTGSCTVQNLMLGTDYYYTISAGDIISDVYSFTTSSEGPRNLYVDGVTNVRDIGGWMTNSGGRIRQGLLIRCGELNEAESTEPCITEEGVAVMRDVLGVKTEIDFRRTEDNEQGGITESPLGSDINYYSEPIGYITDISPDTESIAQTFHLLAEEENYPIIYHCKIGTDRTGLITYLIMGLCDVSMEDIYTDYAFSNLGQIEGKRDPKRLDKMVNDNFADFMGDTPQETARNYLTSIGITEEELDCIVSILVEK